MGRHISTTLNDLIGPDWEMVNLGYKDAGGAMTVQLVMPGLSWTGTLSYSEWHRLVTLGINRLGYLPSTYELESLPVVVTR